MWEYKGIRRNLLGGRINYSARTVIVPNAKLRSYEIGLPYVCFVELYKEVIINLLVKLDGYSYSEAVNKWYSAYRAFDEKIYKIIKYILKHADPKVLLNRNPTINFGSFLCMNVAYVKKDYNDLSCDLPIQSLAALNADFDGRSMLTYLAISLSILACYKSDLTV